MSVTVHPVPGTYLAGVPHVTLEVSAAYAKRLVRTGAFSKDATDASTDPIELPDPPDIEFYDPNPDPADAGSLDSTEA
jgi:hypothetical protein